MFSDIFLIAWIIFTLIAIGWMLFVIWEDGKLNRYWILWAASVLVSISIVVFMHFCNSSVGVGS